MEMKKGNQHWWSPCAKFLSAISHLTQRPHFTDEKGKSKEAGPGQVQVQARWAQGHDTLGACENV